MTINDYDYHNIFQLTSNIIQPTIDLHHQLPIALTQLPIYVFALISQPNSLSSGMLLNETSLIAQLPADGVDQELLKLIVSYLKYKAEKAKAKELSNE